MALYNRLQSLCDGDVYVTGWWKWDQHGNLNRQKLVSDRDLQPASPPAPYIAHTRRRLRQALILRVYRELRLFPIADLEAAIQNYEESSRLFESYLYLSIHDPWRNDHILTQVRQLIWLAKARGL